MEFGITEKKAGAEPSAQTAANLTLFEKKIYDAIGNEPCHIDDIAETAAVPSNEALVNLLSLELKGFVRQLAGKMFVRE